MDLLCHVCSHAFLTCSTYYQLPILYFSRSISAYEDNIYHLLQHICQTLAGSQTCGLVLIGMEGPSTSAVQSHDLPPKEAAHASRVEFPSHRRFSCSIAARRFISTYCYGNRVFIAMTTPRLELTSLIYWFSFAMPARCTIELLMPATLLFL